MEPIKICSSPSLKGLNKLISEYFYSEITIKDNKVFNRNGEIPRCVVEKSKGKFIFKITQP